VAEHPYERIERELRRAFEKHARRLAADLGRASEHLRAHLDQATSDLARIRRQHARMIEDVRRQPGDRRDWTSAEAWTRWPKGPRKPRRKPPGGEPAPVKPRPNPTPLVGGAEAPLD
jgi:hypothetical protein